MRTFTLFCTLLLALGLPLWPQSNIAPTLGQHDDQLSFIGLRLAELNERFGPPRLVYTSRGSEAWQDDVVFVYNEGEFYVYRDRVWQVEIKSIYGMKVGDAKGVALLVLGEDAREEGDYLTYSLSGGAWPLSLRVNFNAGRISAIFVYRPDY